MDSHIDCCLRFHFVLSLGLRHQQEWSLHHEHAAQQVTQHMSSYSFYCIVPQRSCRSMAVGSLGRGHVSLMRRQPGFPEP